MLTQWKQTTICVDSAWSTFRNRGYTEMCIQEVGRAEVDGIKSHMRRSCRQRTLYSSDVACAHIESLPTHSAVEVIRRPYRSSRFSALYLAHSFSIRLVTSCE